MVTREGPRPLALSGLGWVPCSGPSLQERPGWGGGVVREGVLPSGAEGWGKTKHSIRLHLSCVWFTHCFFHLSIFP